MIDKSIPYFNVIMKADDASKAQAIDLPDGYIVRGYKPGDERSWAEIEVANNDFDTVENGIKYFTNKYLCDMERTEKSFIAIENVREGRLAGSVTCWSDERDGEQVSTVHWLVTNPLDQGMGLGKILVAELLKRFGEWGAFPVYLHTQPWSFVAIGIYSAMGFRLCKTDTFRGYDNQNAQALEVLQGLMRPNQYKKLSDEMSD